MIRKMNTTELWKIELRFYDIIESMEKAIAIVGMSCRFAGCASLSAFWDVVRERRSMLTRAGADVELPFGQKNIFNRAYPAYIGQLGDLYACVPSAQNFPRQVNAGENQDLYFATQLAFDALADASIKPHRADPIRGSVRIGYAPPFNSSTVNWLQHTSFLDQTMDILRRFFPHAPEESMDGIRSQLVDSLPPPNAASFLMGAGYRIASWIARECSFSGEASVMDGGILSGAVSLETAIDDLLSGRVSVALAGAVNPPLSREYIEGLSGEVEFSSEAELHPFSRDPHGTIPGEGGAFFVLKRRADALRDHDRIYALIRSTAIGHNPANDPSFIFSEAAQRAKVSATSIGLIEANGSGIALQEAREIAAISKLWGVHRPGAPLVGLGSVTGNIGHTLRASMAAGLVKAALALYHKMLPPQIPTDVPADAINSLESSAYLLNEPRPWISGDSSSPRRAAVMGANFDSVSHVSEVRSEGRGAVIILEEEPEDRA